MWCKLGLPGKSGAIVFEQHEGFCVGRGLGAACPGHNISKHRCVAQQIQIMMNIA